MGTRRTGARSFKASCLPALFTVGTSRGCTTPVPVGCCCFGHLFQAGAPWISVKRAQSLAGTTTLVLSCPVLCTLLLPVTGTRAHRLRSLVRSGTPEMMNACTARRLPNHVSASLVCSKMTLPLRQAETLCFCCALMSFGTAVASPLTSGGHSYQPRTMV